MIEEVTSKTEFTKLLEFNDHSKIVVLYTNSDSFLKTIRVIERLLDDTEVLVERHKLGPYIRYTLGKRNYIFIMRHHKRRKTGNKYPVVRLV